MTHEQREAPYRAVAQRLASVPWPRGVVPVCRPGAGLEPAGEPLLQQQQFAGCTGAQVQEPQGAQGQGLGEGLRDVVMGDAEGQGREEVVAGGDGG